MQPAVKRLLLASRTKNQEKAPVTSDQVPSIDWSALQINIQFVSLFCCIRFDVDSKYLPNKSSAQFAPIIERFSPSSKREAQIDSQSIKRPICPKN